MSAIAGILRFDPGERVTSEQLAHLTRGIGRLGPDGGGEAIEFQIALAFRGFHTTPESHFETQPFSRENVLFAFDGRLDNREELWTVLSQSPDECATDADLVFFAYKKWGTGCFAQFEGDWAISLWDRTKKQLILARDVFGVRRLFYRVDEAGVAWSSALESLVQSYPGTLHLDLEYLSGFLYPRPPIETTPYEEIRACPPSTLMLFDRRGLVKTMPYWSLNPHARIQYKSDRDYELHFRELFRKAVSRRLRSDRPILAELSGGIDSSSIVCMADLIGLEQPGVAVETLSYFDPDEPSGDERPYFSEIEQRRGRQGNHISIAEFARESPSDRLTPLPQDRFTPVPGFFSSSLRWDSTIDEIQKRTNSRVILSGLGGDELLGGVQYEAPELAECIRDGKLITFFEVLYRWSIARKKTVFHLMGETIKLLLLSRNPRLLSDSKGGTLPWALVRPPLPGKALSRFTRWEELSPWALCAEWIRFALAQQLSSTEPPLFGLAERRYPYLDRSLFAFLASVPRTQLIQTDKRRWLMRRAMRGLVPDSVLFRRTKWFGYRRPLIALRREYAAMERMLSEPWLSDRIVIDLACLRTHFEPAVHGSTDNALALISAVAIEQWMRSLDRHIQVAPPASPLYRGALISQALPWSRQKITLNERR